MAVTLKPYVEALANPSNEQAELAQPRADEAAQRLGLKMATKKLELIKCQNTIVEMGRRYPLDEDSILRKADEAALVERQIDQLQKIYDQLFPTAK